MKYLRQINENDQMGLISDVALPNVTLMTGDSGTNILYIPKGSGYVNLVVYTLKRSQIGSDSNVISLVVNGEERTFEMIKIKDNESNKEYYFYKSRFLSDSSNAITVSSPKMSETVEGRAEIYFGHSYTEYDGSGNYCMLIEDTASFDKIFGEIGMTSADAMTAYENSSNENHDRVVTFCEEKMIKYAGRNWWFGGDNEVKYYNTIPLEKAIDASGVYDYSYDYLGIDHNDDLCFLFVEA